MELMLEIISRQKFSLSQDSIQHVFSEVGGYIGRDEECEWILVDKTKQISRRHALISFEHAGFSIEDVSTNGIYNALGRERLEKGKKYRIEHGNTYIIGEYSIQARLLHKPDSYLSGQEMQDGELIPDGEPLADDPLLALEQQDELDARKRLGLYNDLLGTEQEKTPPQADHTEAPLAAMPEIALVPEDWNEDGDEPEAPAAQAAPLSVTPTPPPPATPPVPPPATPETPPSATPEPLPETPSQPEEPPRSENGPEAASPEVEAFFRALGFASAPATRAEREQIMLRAAELITASVDGMLQALRNRADSKNELRLPVTTMTLAGNNPLKFSPTGKAALHYLLAAPEEDFLSPAQAMQSGFADLHSHSLGLMAGARAAIQAMLTRISPRSVEMALDTVGTARFLRTRRLWNTYARMHARLRDADNGFAAFFLEDFARAYEMQVRTLHPAFVNRQGDEK